jgi:hypothetical protein
MPQDCLGQFIESMKLASTDRRHEKAVRFMVEGMAKDCPIPLLIELGQCLVDYRKQELREEASLN